VEAAAATTETTASTTWPSGRLSGGDFLVPWHLPMRMATSEQMPAGATTADESDVTTATTAGK